MNGTLPLFQELEPPAGAQQATGDHPATEHPATEEPQRPPADPSDSSAASDRHLRAAWRLSRSMRRFRDGSPEQTRAGLAICRHLQALLAQADHRS